MGFIYRLLQSVSLVAILCMITNVFYDVIMRYFFRSGSVGLQELEWHWFSVIIMLGISYTLLEDAHVRVDVLYDRFSSKKKALVNMIGAVFFILPICLLVGISSIGFAYDAFVSMEKSGDPGGLHYRWIVKSLQPVGFFFLIVATVGFFMQNFSKYRQAKNETEVA